MSMSDYYGGDFFDEPPNMAYSELYPSAYAHKKAAHRQSYSHHSLTQWRDAQGKTWLIRNMKDGHLCNTIRMLGRKFSEVQRSNDFIGYDSDFAARGPVALFPVYAALFREALKRGLTP